MKQSKPNHHLFELFISEYILDRDLCVVRTYLHYLGRTEKLRQDTHLFVTTQKPYSWVSKATLSHWIKDTLLQSGIDMSCFSPHSTQSAS